MRQYNNNYGSIFRMLSFGLFPSACSLNANVSEHLLFQLAMKMQQAQCSETLALKLQALGNNPKESIGHSKHGKSLKSRIFRPTIPGRWNPFISDSHNITTNKCTNLNTKFSTHTICHNLQTPHHN
jgi:hypothetical protein